MSETWEVQDKYNPAKTWVIKRYDSGNYYVNQKIHGRMFYSRFSRVTKRSLKNAVLFVFDGTNKSNGGNAK